MAKSRADHHVLEHAHESPWVMLAPLVVLAFGAVFAGWLLDNWFIGARTGSISGTARSSTARITR